MKTYKVKIQFDGHEYLGWQIQKESRPTVQGQFNQALELIFKQPIKSVASGRTDTGVHALEHHVVFTAPFEIPHPSLVKALNSNLPASIRCYDCVEVEKSFRPTNDALQREYHYFFSNEKVASPFTRHYMTNIKHDLKVDAMQKACKLFEGTHDFNRFHCVGSDPSTTVRTIFKCELTLEAPCLGGIVPKHFVLKVSGTGFLKQMVRLIIGAIWKVGDGTMKLTEVEQALINPVGKHIAAVAPPKGLFKFSVQSPD